MSSSSPEKYTRKWYLNRLCKSIFGKVRIGFEAEDGIPYIIYKSGFADKCDFKSLENMAGYRKKMELLLHYTFLSDGTVFDFQYKGDDYTREIAIQNAIGFFMHPEDDADSAHIGLNVHKFNTSEITDAQLLYTGLSQYVLCAIFEAQPDSKKDFARENIQDTFRLHLQAFDNYLLQKDAFRNEIAKLADEELYFDPRFCQQCTHKKGKSLEIHLGECNYAIPFSIDELFPLPIIQPVIIRIAVGSNDPPPITEEQKFKQMVSGYIPLSTDTKEIAQNSVVYCNYNIPNMPNILEYCLSDIAPKNIINYKKIYYLTRIDKSILESLYQNPQNHEELHSQILMKARSHIKEKNPDYKHIEDDYAQYIIDYIEDIIGRFQTLIRYKEFLQSKEPDIPTGTEILNIFHIPFQKIFDLLPASVATTYQWNIIFISFESAFKNFQNIIKSQNIIHFIRENTSINTRNEHMHHCKERIISPDVDKAINLQKENENKLLEVSYISCTGFEFKRIPDFVSEFKKDVEQYLTQLGR